MGLFFDGGFECSTARNLAYSFYCVFNEAVFVSSFEFCNRFIHSSFSVAPEEG